MRRPYSLRGRLSLWLTLGAVLLWVLAVGLAAGRLRHETGEIFDSVLQETSQRLLPLATLEILARDEDDNPEQGIATLRGQDEYLTWLVRDANGRVLMRSYQANPASFPPFVSAGFTNTDTHRIYSDSTLQGRITISVADPLAHRHSAVHAALIALILPLGLIVPASLIGIPLIVRAVLAPVQQFRQGIEMRGRGDLSPVSEEGLPTEFRPNARAVNSLLDRLRRALEAERSFTANSAHELRTPVAAALAQVQRLIIEMPDKQAQARLAEVETALRRLSRLAEKLMQLARAEGGRLQAENPADLVPILRLLTAEMNQDPDHPIALSLPDGPFMARIDPDSFAILARNLIENAQRHGDRDQPIEVSLSSAGVLRVINAAKPVPTDQLGRLMRPFERGPTCATGSGLGLAIAQAIANGTEGRLDLISPASGRQDGFEAVFTIGTQPARQT